jgi:preprotein translocase subunit YajC
LIKTKENCGQLLVSLLPFAFIFIFIYLYIVLLTQQRL